MVNDPRIYHERRRLIVDDDILDNAADVLSSGSQAAKVFAYLNLKHGTYILTKRDLHNLRSKLHKKSNQQKALEVLEF